MRQEYVLLTPRVVELQQYEGKGLQKLGSPHLPKQLFLLPL